MVQKMLTQEKVRELFDYRDGMLIWKSKGKRVVVGNVAGGVSGNMGYHMVSVGGKKFCAHRVIWLWHHGYMPENDVDHINRDKTDNRIENLREVSRSCNMRNTDNLSNCTSGVKGVSFDNPSGFWMAQITVRGRSVYLGRYPDFTEAVCHRLAAEQAENWAGCDNCSPAFLYVKNTINNGETP